MPESWYNWNANRVPKDEDPNTEENQKKTFNKEILADKKPYFMKYVYPAEKNKIDEYIKKNNEKSLMRFRLTLDELIEKPDKSEEEARFVKCYYQRMPVGMNPCTINRICWRIEELFDDIKFESDEAFDYSILKSQDVEYPDELFNRIKTIYQEYKTELSRAARVAKAERVKSDEWAARKYIMRERFKHKCLSICPNEDYLCNIVLDLCYSNSKVSKQFAWDVCGDVFIENLLKRHNYIISYPIKDENGDIEFDGERFSMTTADLNVYEEDEGDEDEEWE